MKHIRLERYLRDATRGLPPKKRVAVMRELRGNLEQHVLDRMVAGVAQARALEEILDDFGAPQLVSKGMWGLYMKPRWTKMMVGVGLVTALSLPVLVASASSVAVLRQDSQHPYAWVGLDSVFQALDWTDARLSLVGKHLKVTKGSFDLYSITYADPKYIGFDVKREREGKYVQANVLISVLSNYSAAAVYFDSPINTIFKVGDKTINFTKLGFDVDFRGALAMQLGQSLTGFIKQFVKKDIISFTTIQPGLGYQHYVKGNAEPNHPYLALWTGVVKGYKKPENQINFGILQSDANGDFKFETSHHEVYFTPNWESLNRMKNNEILLVKMTGRINPDWKKSLQQGRGLIDPSSVLKIPVSIGQKTL